jgi:hypothetical protein
MKCVSYKYQHPFNYVNPTLEEKDFKLIKDLLFAQSGNNNGILNPDVERYVHLDLSENTDHAGLAMSHKMGNIPVMRKICGELITEYLPKYHTDLMLRIKPPKNALGIDYQKIRSILYLLLKLGFNIALVTFDRVKGEMNRFLEENGIKTEYLSMDKNLDPWNVASLLIKEERVRYYAYEPFFEEMPFLFFDEKAKKVDHRKNKKKDLSDAWVGSIYNTYINNESGDRHRVTFDQEFQEVMLINTEPDNLHDDFYDENHPNFYGKEYV